MLLGTYQADLAPHISERVCFCMADRSGDILVGMLDRPAEPQANRPLVILVHGITGCENSSHVLNGARHLLDLGYRVLRLNLRGCGASRPHCREHYHIGRTADFRRVLSQLPDDLTDNGIAVVGYSMGGAMLLKYLGEEGSFSPLRAAATICAPLDLKRTCEHMQRPRNWLYHNYILADIKKETLAEGGELSAKEREIVRSVRSVREYDDRFIAPRYGFRDVDDYYELCAPLNYMPEIRVPTMVLAARRRSVDSGGVLSGLQMVGQSVPAVGDGRRRWASRLPCGRQQPSVVRHGAGEIPGTSLTDEFDRMAA